MYEMLNVEKLVLYYDEINAIKEVSFEVRASEIVTIIGANGAGKSTILRAISGIIPIHSGSIFFLGNKINGLSPAKIVGSGITHVPEGRGIFPKLTVGENLRIGAFRRMISRKKDKETLNSELNADIETIYGYFPVLKDRERQYGGTLSGGEQQMLAIGRGLMARPKIMLLDEPSLGLAPLLVRSVLEIISEIHRTGLPILLVEQKAFLALKLTERGYVLENGRIVLEGRTEELLKSEHVRTAYLG
jgi:branched-chain amino acid transport system ATP-binding protein